MPQISTTGLNLTDFTEAEFSRAWQIVGSKHWYTPLAMTIERVYGQELKGRRFLEIGACWRSPSLRRDLIARGAEVFTTGYEDPEKQMSATEYLLLCPHSFDSILAPGVLSTDSVDPDGSTPNTIEGLGAIYAAARERLVDDGLLITTVLKREIASGQALSTEQVEAFGYKNIAFDSLYVRGMSGTLQPLVFAKV